MEMRANSPRTSGTLSELSTTSSPVDNDTLEIYFSINFMRRKRFDYLKRFRVDFFCSVFIREFNTQFSIVSRPLFNVLPYHSTYMNLLNGPLITYHFNFLSDSTF